MKTPMTMTKRTKTRMNVPRTKVKLYRSSDIAIVYSTQDVNEKYLRLFILDKLKRTTKVENGWMVKFGGIKILARNGVRVYVYRYINAEYDSQRFYDKYKGALEMGAIKHLEWIENGKNQKAKKV